MEDILIVSSRDSQAAALWVNYLTTCFNQISKQRNRPPFKVLTVSLEDVVGPGSIPASLEEKMVRVKLQIVIVCPQFLEQVYQHPAPALGKLLQPDRVLAMLLGVEEDNVTEQHRAEQVPVEEDVTEQVCVEEDVTEQVCVEEDNVTGQVSVEEDKVTIVSSNFTIGLP
ncbi:unnamed protein product, partial [Timema podura]|nr:unnamed protein product [Timema podura]